MTRYRDSRSHNSIDSVAESAIRALLCHVFVNMETEANRIPNQIFFTAHDLILSGDKNSVEMARDILIGDGGDS